MKLCQNSAVTRAISHFVLVTALVVAGGFRPSTSGIAGADENTGLITGTLYYQHGGVVSGATVYAQPMGRPMESIVPHAETDEHGHFKISRLWFARYAINASKTDEGYPDNYFQFYSDGKFETVVLTARHPMADVAVHLGPKAGIFIGTVSDAVTGAPLTPCVELRRAANPANFLSASGLIAPEYRLLLPANTGVYVKIWLDGYRFWYYPGTNERSQSKPAHLAPGEVQILDIRLQPGKNSAEGTCGPPVGRRINR